jgi:hypothetical protein
MIKSRSIRKTTRLTVRRPIRNLDRHCLRGRCGPSDLSQAFTAFGRALRAHRRLARLAPRFFDSVVVERERLHRAERRAWMKTWEPAFEKVYGPTPAAERAAWEQNDQPRLPGPHTQQVIERELAEWNVWFAAGSLAMARHRQRRPHALLTFSQIARLLKLGFALARLACGLDATGKPPEPLNYDYSLAALKRSYPTEPDAPAS